MSAWEGHAMTHEWEESDVVNGSPTMRCVKCRKRWFPDQTVRQMGACVPGPPAYPMCRECGCAISSTGGNHKPGCSWPNEAAP